ncbi:MAG: hypothetical protein ACR2QM_18925 [Longimicrobiales bacterium]
MVAGSCHDLNGRSSALFGLAELARAGEDPDFMAGALNSEAKRLQDVALSLRILFGRSNNSPEILALSDRLGPVVSLFSVQPGAELLAVELATDPDAPAVRAPWRCLSRAVLLTMSVVAANVLAAGSRGTVRIAYMGDDHGPFLEIDGYPIEPGAPDPAADDLITAFQEWPPELTQAIQGFGGSCSFSANVQNEKGAGPRAEVRLPGSSA